MLHQQRLSAGIKKSRMAWEFPSYFYFKYLSKFPWDAIKGVE